MWNAVLSHNCALNDVQLFSTACVTCQKLRRVDIPCLLHISCLYRLRARYGTSSLKYSSAHADRWVDQLQCVFNSSRMARPGNISKSSAKSLRRSIKAVVGSIPPCCSGQTKQTEAVQRDHVKRLKSEQVRLLKARQIRLHTHIWASTCCCNDLAQHNNSYKQRQHYSKHCQAQILPVVS